MQKALQSLLAFLSKRVLARYRPIVVAVAGSVGKTSTTRAVTAVLARSFRTRGSAKNHNNEIGVPLTILGEAKSGGASPIAWLGILTRGFRLAYGPAQSEMPQVLVLEMATDHPGDLEYLTRLAPPDISVLTAISEEHTEFLGDLDGVAREEGTVVRALGEKGKAVLNADDGRVLVLASGLGDRAILYGFSSGARVQAENVSAEIAHGTVFTRFTMRIDGRALPVNLSGTLGDGHVSAALAAAAVALALGVEPDLIPYGLAQYQPPPGRLRVLPGIKATTLIDDTYNSSPRAAELALATLMAQRTAPGGRRIIVLGDMLELGGLSEEAHRRIGRAVAASRADLFFGVGPVSALSCEAALAAGMPTDRVRHFNDAASTATALKETLRAGDLILIKASQGIRLERVVKALMANPETAGELLVRQTKEWLT
jgi:UDP-N-acetylmuramoyl-tripeptide--D-alanyl-D-alanine ligase